MPTLSRITVYPIKALDGHDLPVSEVLPSGALAEDRRFALVDTLGRHVNGKRFAAIHGIRARFSEDLRQVTLSYEQQSKGFEIATERDRLATWCGEVLGINCRLVENTETGFPDDAVSPGPTIISTASLETVTSWFEGLDLAEARRRVRFNLEVSDSPPFWEDRLVPEMQKALRFRIGAIVWQGRGVCARCVVPTRDSADGTVAAGFAREFSRRREENLPDWAPLDRFDHFYRLGVNTVLDSCNNGDCIAVGDAVEIA